MRQSQKSKYCTSFAQGTKSYQSHRHGKTGGCQELGGTGDWELVFKRVQSVLWDGVRDMMTGTQAVNALNVTGLCTFQSLRWSISCVNIQL